MHIMDAVLLAEVNVIEHVHVTTNKCNELKKAKKKAHCCHRMRIDLALPCHYDTLMLTDSLGY